MATCNHQYRNKGLISNILNKIGINAIISLIENIEAADKLILQGVGSFYSGMRNLEAMEIVRTLDERIIQKNTYSWHLLWNAVNRQKK